MKKIKDFYLTEKQERKIVKAIRKAERKTSGEIRVHIDSHVDHSDHVQVATAAFQALGMEKTQHRNAVLFHVCPEDKALTIVADKGINDIINPEDFWKQTHKVVCRNFKKGKYARGLREGIKIAGKALKKYFPHGENDINELPDEISRV